MDGFVHLEFWWFSVANNAPKFPIFLFISDLQIGCRSCSASPNPSLLLATFLHQRWGLSWGIQQGKLGMWVASIMQEGITFLEDGLPLHAITISSKVMSAYLSLSIKMKCRSMFYDWSRCWHRVLYLSLPIVTWPMLKVELCQGTKTDSVLLSDVMYEINYYLYILD